MKKISEHEIEEYAIKAVHEAGGFTRKLQWIGRKGAPDRLIALKGMLTLAEIKKKKTCTDYVQDHEHLLFKMQGIPIWVPKTFEDVDAIIQHILEVRKNGSCV